MHAEFNHDHSTANSRNYILSRLTSSSTGKKAEIKSDLTANVINKRIFFSVFLKLISI